MLESDSSYEQLYALTEYQILFNAWSVDQFQGLDINGWVDPYDASSKPWAYKFKSMYLPEDKTFDYFGEPWKVYPISNKYCPVFFREFFTLRGLNADDYLFYFDRSSFDIEKLYFAGAEMGETILAHNGFVYKTDAVVLPLPTGDEILGREYEGYSFSKFQDLVHSYAIQYYNLEATMSQPGVEEGYLVEPIYNVHYSNDLIFNINCELTGNTSNPFNTMHQHHGLMAPTNQAFDSFMETYLQRFKNHMEIGRLARLVIVNSYMYHDGLYLTNIQKGFDNAEGDFIKLDESDVIQRTYGSNCTFIGLKKAIVPRVLTTICAPLFTEGKNEVMKYAIDEIYFWSILKRLDRNFIFYLPVPGDPDRPNEVAGLKMDRSNNTFAAWNPSLEKYISISTGDLRNLIRGQIATDTPKGIAGKEFIGTYKGTHIIVNNKTGIVSGTAPTKDGIYGNRIIQLKPKLYPGEYDNGKVYEVASWFSFSSNSWYGYLISKHFEFYKLLQKAGLFDNSMYVISFIADREKYNIFIPKYTVFIPSSQAITDYGLDTLNKSELADLLKYHFIENALIFTDGESSSRVYLTVLEDREQSDEYITKFTSINIRPKPDVIEILDKNGEVYVSIPEDEDKTNQIISYNSSFYGLQTGAVLHTIDKVLMMDSLYIP
jgi:uncharacterized surface protein with fasciclin (FAS1) repeats